MPLFQDTSGFLAGTTAGNLGVNLPGALLAYNAIRSMPFGIYETVPPSATDQVLGVGGNIGDLLLSLIFLPSATQINNTFSIKDGTTAITALANAVGGAAVSTIPYRLDIGAISVNGAWKVTTGSGMTILAIGMFT
jgi:hypothetical protein